MGSEPPRKRARRRGPKQEQNLTQKRQRVRFSEDVDVYTADSTYQSTVTDGSSILNTEEAELRMYEEMAGWDDGEIDDEFVGTGLDGLLETSKSYFDDIRDYANAMAEDDPEMQELKEQYIAYLEQQASQSAASVPVELPSDAMETKSDTTIEKPSEETEMETYKQLPLVEAPVFEDAEELDIATRKFFNRLFNSLGPDTIVDTLQRLLEVLSRYSVPVIASSIAEILITTCQMLSPTANTIVKEIVYLTIHLSLVDSRFELIPMHCLQTAACEFVRMALQTISTDIDDDEAHEARCEHILTAILSFHVFGFVSSELLVNIVEQLLTQPSELNGWLLLYAFSNIGRYFKKHCEDAISALPIPLLDPTTRIGALFAEADILRQKWTKNSFFDQFIDSLLDKLRQLRRIKPSQSIVVTLQMLIEPEVSALQLLQRQTIAIAAGTVRESHHHTPILTLQAPTPEIELLLQKFGLNTRLRKSVGIALFSPKSEDEAVQMLLRLNLDMVGLEELTKIVLKLIFKAKKRESAHYYAKICCAVFSAKASKKGRLVLKHAIRNGATKLSLNFSNRKCDNLAYFLVTAIARQALSLGSLLAVCEDPQGFSQPGEILLARAIGQMSTRVDERRVKDSARHSSQRAISKVSRFCDALLDLDSSRVNELTRTGRAEIAQFRSYLQTSGI